MRVRPPVHGTDMSRRLIPVLLALAGGVLIATWWPGAPDAVHTMLAGARGAAAPAKPEPHAAAGPEPERSGLVKLTDDQVGKAGIRTDGVGGGNLSRHLHVPGTIVPNANLTARIAVKTTGTVVELRKGLGDKVAKGEVVALLDSREIADAKGEYLAARVSAVRKGLTKTTLPFSCCSTPSWPGATVTVAPSLTLASSEVGTASSIQTVERSATV